MVSRPAGEIDRVRYFKFKTLGKALFPLGLGFILCFALSYVDLNWLEARLYDFRVQNSLTPTPSSEIVLITWDDRTIRELETEFPAPLSHHAALLNALAPLRPRAVGYPIDLNRAAELGKTSPHAFLTAARTMMREGTPVLLGTTLDVTGEIHPPAPLHQLPHALAITHKDGNVFSGDKVTRRALLRTDGKATFPLRLAQELGRVSEDFHPTGSYWVEEAQSDFFFFRYNLKPDRPSYARVSAIDILKGRFEPESLRGKILLVGTVSREDSSDFSMTPYSKNPVLVPKLAIQANILESILQNNGIQQLPFSMNLLIATITTALVIGWVILSSPFSGLLATFVLGLSFLLVSHFIFSLSGLWIRAAEPLAGMLLSYYVLVPYRLIREYKARWAYQRRNDILIQVEELKRNFLSLVTHDLKTPVARIQGLADLLLRRADHRFTASDKETLKHISSAAEELDRFINSLLELTRIDSGKFELNLASKDVNTLIESSIESFQSLAREKNITIENQLEPLFPIRVDPLLISKVLRNLIDNAIKYSPPGGMLTLTSQEENTTAPGVLICVKDQGIGMSESEKAQLFSRFYRIKNEQTTNTSGTGLGLYLSRYFIEAHGGKLTVQSSPGEGSTFSIWLPEVPTTKTSFASSPRPPTGLLTRLKQNQPQAVSPSIQEQTR